MPNPEHKTLFERWLQAWTARDAAAVLAFYDENCVIETPTMGTLKGRAALEEADRKLFVDFVNLSFEDVELTMTDDRLVATGIASGIDASGTLTRAGTEFRFPAILMWNVRDGRVVRERRLWDFSRFLLQRVQRELNDAAEVQRLLLPPGGFAREGFEVAAASIPARTIGGDFFDYFELPDGGFAFALGDIAGKGPSAALLGASVLAILAAGRHSDRPGAALEEANHAMLRRAVPGKYATVVFATVSKNGRLTYCNGGHNPPLLLGAEGVRWLKTGGTFIGMFPGMKFDEETLQLKPGDRLVTYSDGITEARNTDGEEFGEERLQSCVEANREQASGVLVKSILDAVQRFSAGTPQGDDLTVLVLSRN